MGDRVRAPCTNLRSSLRTPTQIICDSAVPFKESMGKDNFSVSGLLSEGENQSCLESCVRSLMCLVPSDYSMVIIEANPTPKQETISATAWEHILPWPWRCEQGVGNEPRDPLRGHHRGWFIEVNPTHSLPIKPSR